MEEFKNLQETKLSSQPIFDGDVLLGSINAGFFQSNEGKTTRRICRACRQEPPL